VESGRLLYQVIHFNFSIRQLPFLVRGLNISEYQKKLSVLTIARARSERGTSGRWKPPRPLARHTFAGTVFRAAAALLRPRGSGSQVIDVCQ
jgi:hypothetical protein